eukprot:GHVH01000871.1.p1 GENE.GHVH01000871.1~~GHVH01000871.1.p1  ORF type:complete len:502 (+),score=93.47 GHVH01000871.1:50-1555(+)
MFRNHTTGEDSDAAGDSSDDELVKKKYVPSRETAAPVFVRAKEVYNHEEECTKSTVNPFGVDEEQYSTNPVDEKPELSQKVMKKTYGVGLKLLQKMGFKSGGGIGKNEDGRLNPVPVTLQKGKSGLSDIVKPPEEVTVNDIEDQEHVGLGVYEVAPAWSTYQRRPHRVQYKTRDGMLDEMKKIFQQTESSGAMKIIDMTSASGPRMTDSQTIGRGVVSNVDTSLMSGSPEEQLQYRVELAIQSLEGFIQDYHRSQCDVIHKRLGIESEIVRITNKKTDIEENIARLDEVKRDVERLMTANSAVLGVEDSFKLLSSEGLSEEVSSFFNDASTLIDANASMTHGCEVNTLVAHLLSCIIENMEPIQLVHDDLRAIILKWRRITNEEQWNYLITRFINPKMVQLLSTVEITASSNFEVLVTFSKWSPVPLDIDAVSKILAKDLLPRWVNALETWLTSNPTPSAVIAWYSNWRSYLPKEVIEESPIAREFMAKGLNAIRMRYEIS